MSNDNNDDWMSAEDKEDRYQFRMELSRIKERTDIHTPEKMRLMREAAIQRSNERVAGIRAQRAVDVLNSGRGVSMSVEDAINLLEDDELADAMCERITSGAALH